MYPTFTILDIIIIIDIFSLKYIASIGCNAGEFEGDSVNLGVSEVTQCMQCPYGKLRMMGYFHSCYFFIDFGVNKSNSIIWLKIPIKILA